jgi:hypothetical protein
MGWDIILSLATPFAVAALLFLLEKHGPWAKALQKPTKLVGPYFTAVAILFGLFTAQLMNDAWQKDNAAWQSVRMEDDALRAMIQLARINEQPTLLPIIKAYAVADAKEDPHSLAARNTTDAAYEALVDNITHAPTVDNSVRSFELATAGEMRRARDRRLYLTDDAVAPAKWFSILILGALTQLAILLVHTGSRSAVRVSVMLFTVAFAFCLVMVAIFDMPFETILFSEPATTLNATIKTF